MQQDNGDIQESIEDGNDEAAFEDHAGEAVHDLDDESMDYLEEFEMAQSGTYHSKTPPYNGGDFDGESMSMTMEGIDMDRARMMDIREDLDDAHAGPSRLTEHNLGVYASQQLQSLNGDRPASPESHFSGDTNEMDPGVYELFYMQKRLWEEERLAERRRRETEATIDDSQ